MSEEDLRMDPSDEDCDSEHDQNRYTKTDLSLADTREACFSPQELRGPADINRVVVPIDDRPATTTRASRSHATKLVKMTPENRAGTLKN